MGGTAAGGEASLLGSGGFRRLEPSPLMGGAAGWGVRVHTGPQKWPDHLSDLDWLVKVLSFLSLGGVRHLQPLQLVASVPCLACWSTPGLISGLIASGGIARVAEPKQRQASATLHSQRWSGRTGGCSGLQSSPKAVGDGTGHLQVYPSHFNAKHCACMC